MSTVTRAQLAAFWDEQLDLWLRGEQLSPRLNEWRRAYGAEIQEWAFPEPYIGDLLGSPRIVLLANNPGIAHEQLQSRGGVFAPQIRELGLTAWAATRPYEGQGSPWVRLRGEIPHNWDRIRFARRFLGDDAMSRLALLNLELFPWHSPRLERAIRVDPLTLHEFILEPLAEFAHDVPVVALGVAWSRALDHVPEVVLSCANFADFSVRSRRARLYTTREGCRILVVWHSGSDKPPNATDTEHLRSIWFGDSRRGAAASAADAPRPTVRAAGVRQAMDPEPTKRDKDIPANVDIAALAETLQRWIDDEFAGLAVADENVPGRVRLYVQGSAARIGWNIARRWLHVWVKKLRDGESEMLRAELSEPGSLKTNKDDVSFRVYNEPDLGVLRKLIRRRVEAQPR